MPCCVLGFEVRSDVAPAVENLQCRHAESLGIAFDEQSKIILSYFNAIQIAQTLNSQPCSLVLYRVGYPIETGLYTPAATSHGGDDQLNSKSTYLLNFSKDRTSMMLGHFHSHCSFWADFQPQIYQSSDVS